METAITDLNNIDDVYEPSEDSYLLIDSLESDLTDLNYLKPSILMEIGSGSGVVINSLALACKNKWPGFFIAVDINPSACRATKNTSFINNNNNNVDVIQMDLASAVTMRNQFDVIIFNPPYVPTESREVTDPKLITRAWAGGTNGREVMDQLFPSVPKLLAPGGLFYCVTVKENNIPEIIKIFEGLNMRGGIVADRKVRGEHLHILRFVKLID
ncbi:methyltransferase N6AMT1 [Microplitis mediator]|uniref:methyltransferase N6AMT1 n=1 Tax=Microplitis mediator TaxID=375433 RepID=UPI00255350C0|nr:methyltransferase N6AMT1 [Microplitis mediator]